MTNGKKGKVGVQDIADILNISASTVSRALNDHPRISKDTKDKVLQVARRLGYFSGMPDFAAPERGEVIALMVPSLEYAFYREVIYGARDYLEKKDYDISIFDTRKSDKYVSGLFGKYKNFGISGIIHVVSDRTIPAGFYSGLIDDAMPVVSVFEPESETGISSVLPDMFNGVYQSVKYLQSVGVNRVALLLEHENCPVDHQIVSSFLSAYESVSGNTEDVSFFYTEMESKSSDRIVAEIIGRDERPEVIFVKNVTSSFEVISYLQREGIDVPGDMMVITIDTVSGTKQLSGNMSLLKIPAYEMGYKAAQVLMAQLANPKTDKKISVIPSNFILKGSAMRMG